MVVTKAQQQMIDMYGQSGIEHLQYLSNRRQHNVSEGHSLKNFYSAMAHQLGVTYADIKLIYEAVDIYEKYWFMAEYARVQQQAQ